MSDQRTKALEYDHSNGEAFLNSLYEILSIPSISTDPERTLEMNLAAEWIASQLKNLGMQNVRVYPTDKHPIVFGELIKSTSQPTVLIYGHYDVQPVDPLELWKSQPFEPTKRGENLFARGASDMKGQVVAVIKAVESLVKTGGLPVNVKWIIEGEEEIGSPNLESFIADHKQLLACDFALNTDSGMIGEDAPSITYALRGLAYFELKVIGPATDLHSGIYGGVVHNPANALSELIAGMHDENGRITLPGFYDDVLPISDEERAEMARLPLTGSHYLEQTGVPALAGEVGFTPNERASARPTLDVNGLLSGFTGVGSKTVIPSWAMAKLSMRLVPDQDPNVVHSQLLEYLKAKAPKDIRWELKSMSGGRASISSRDSTAVLALSDALAAAWGKKPYFKREGGSVPVVIQMQKLLGVDSVLTGFGLPDDNLHAPNEKLHLPTWFKGIDALIIFLLNLAK
jgi:acetylornithine deacetylase/succinyl-diaminopimelate desuccinylase-like protein